MQWSSCLGRARDGNHHLEVAPEAVAPSAEALDIKVERRTGRAGATAGALMHAPLTNGVEQQVDFGGAAELGQRQLVCLASGS